eukprot:gene22174-1300_t
MPHLDLEISVWMRNGNLFPRTLSNFQISLIQVVAIHSARDGWAVQTPDQLSRLHTDHMKIAEVVALNTPFLPEDKTTTQAHIEDLRNRTQTRASSDDKSLPEN